MKLRILIIIATNNIGGPGKGIFQLINHSDKNKVEFLLANFIQKDQCTFEFLEESERQGIKTHLIRQNSRLDFSMVRQVADLIKSKKCDLIQTHGYKGHIIGFLLRRKYGVKWITVAHGWTNENFRIRVYTFIEKIFIRLSDYAIAVSPKLYETVSKLRGIKKPTDLILNAITDIDPPLEEDLEKIRQKYHLGECKLLGVFGRFSNEKGQAFAIKALRIVKRQYKDVKLLLLGEGVDELKLKALVEDQCVQDDVIFCGYQSNISTYLKLVDFVIVPSLSEGIPNIILESLYLNKPVICTNVGGIPDIVKDNYNGCLVEPGSENEISSKILELMDNTERVDSIICNARASLYPKFSVKNRVQLFLNVYKKTCGQT